MLAGSRCLPYQDAPDGSGHQLVLLTLPLAISQLWQREFGQDNLANFDHRPYPLAPGEALVGRHPIVSDRKPGQHIGRMLNDPIHHVVILRDHGTNARLHRQL